MPTIPDPKITTSYAFLVAYPRIAVDLRQNESPHTIPGPSEFSREGCTRSGRRTTTWTLPDLLLDALHCTSVRCPFSLLLLALEDGMAWGTKGLVYAVHSMRCVELVDTRPAVRGFEDLPTAVSVW
jgi:hypothetical protein